MAEYCVEIADVGIKDPKRPSRDRLPRCRRQHFQVTGDVLRGRMTKMHLQAAGCDLNDAQKKAPDVVLGMFLAVDTDKKICRQVDPYSLPEYAEQAAELKSFSEKNSLHGRPSLGGKPVEPTIIEKASESDVKTWLYWMRRFMDDGMAVNVAGFKALPSEAEIAKLPGKTRFMMGDTSLPGNARLYREDFDDCGNYVPQPEKELAGTK